MIIREMLVVGAIFPLPFIVSAITTLAQVAAGFHPARLTEALPGHPGGSAVLLTLAVVVQLAPVAVIWYLLSRSGETMRDIGLSFGQPGRDVLRGVLLAVAVFVASAIPSTMIARLASHASYGLVLGHHLGAIFLLPGLSMAIWAAVVEEVVVAGYLLHRLSQLGVPQGRALWISTAVRTSYHIYYGLGALAVVPFGLIFGWMWQRNKRLIPLIVAHAIYDGVLIGLTIALSR